MIKAEKYFIEFNFCIWDFILPYIVLFFSYKLLSNIMHYSLQFILCLTGLFHCKQMIINYLHTHNNSNMFKWIEISLNWIRTEHFLLSLIYEDYSLNFIKFQWEMGIVSSVRLIINFVKLFFKENNSQ